jgi:hypothetical protein
VTSILTIRRLVADRHHQEHDDTAISVSCQALHDLGFHEGGGIDPSNSGLSPQRINTGKIDIIPSLLKLPFFNSWHINGARKSCHQVGCVGVLGVFLIAVGSETSCGALRAERSRGARWGHQAEIRRQVRKAALTGRFAQIFFSISCSVLTISFVLLVLLIILQRRLVANGRRSVEGQSLIIPRSLFMRASTRLRVMLLPCYHADVVCIHGRAQACRLGCLLESIGNPEAYNFYTAARPLGGKIRSTNIKRGQLFFACPCMRAGKKYLLFAYLCWLL